VAGILVGESDLSHQILGEIQPLRDILAGLFFVSIGMLVDPRFVLEYAPLVAATVALIALQGAPADGLGVFGFAGYAAAGTLFALRRPRNAVGWLLLAVAAAFAVSTVGTGYASAPSNPASPNSLTMTAMRRPFAWFNRPRSSVVLPAPRNPVITVTGTRFMRDSSRHFA